jgi:hypothetical protein
MRDDYLFSRQQKQQEPYRRLLLGNYLESRNNTAGLFVLHESIEVHLGIVYDEGVIICNADV